MLRLKIGICLNRHRLSSNCRGETSIRRFWGSELVIRAEQKRLFVVSAGAEVTVAAGQGRPPTSLQRGLLGVLLICRREIMDGVLDHVTWIHGFFQAARNTLHWSTAT